MCSVAVSEWRAAGRQCAHPATGSVRLDRTEVLPVGRGIGLDNVRGLIAATG